MSAQLSSSLRASRRSWMSGRMAATSSLVAGALLLACAGGAHRTVLITATDSGCEPTRVDVAVGEQVTFEVRNQARGDREFEGIEGTQINEALVPAGKTREFPYTVQPTDKPLKVKCYAPGGPTTLIELVPGAAPAATVAP